MIPGGSLMFLEPGILIGSQILFEHRMLSSVSWRIFRSLIIKKEKEKKKQPFYRIFCSAGEAALMATEWLLGYCD